MTKPKKLVVILCLLVVVMVLVIFALKNKPSLVKKDRVVVDTNLNKGVSLTTYINTDHGFSFTYPDGFIVDKPTEFSCNTQNEFKYFTVKPGIIVPLEVKDYVPMNDTINLSKENIDQNKVFAGRFVYRYNGCEFGNLVSFTIVKKAKGFDLDSYLNKKVQQDNTHQPDSPTGYKVSRLLIEVNGKGVPVIRTEAFNSTHSIEDTYYFDQGKYLYMLGDNFSQTVLDMPANEKMNDNWSRIMWQDHQLSQKIISGFKISNQ
ncbi:MAG TPA: hypothetical protein VJB09_00155 [Candidatus Paceibacterota bacterium]